MTKKRLDMSVNEVLEEILKWKIEQKYKGKRKPAKRSLMCRAKHARKRIGKRKKKETWYI